MNEREVLIPEIKGKTILAMRIVLTGSSAEMEVAIDFTDGTSFSSTTHPQMHFEAELYTGGIGEPQIIKQYE